MTFGRPGRGPRVPSWAPYTYTRRMSGNRARYLVLDRASGEIVGVVVKSRDGWIGYDYVTQRTSVDGYRGSLQTAVGNVHSAWRTAVAAAAGEAS
jgi:hypothetical protein